MIFSRINNDAGTAVNLLNDYKDLNVQNMINHAANIWGAIDNIIAPATT